MERIIADDILLYGEEAYEFAHVMYRPSREEIEYWENQNSSIDRELTIYETEDGFEVESELLDLSFLDETTTMNEKLYIEVTIRYEEQLEYVYSDRNSSSIETVSVHSQPYMEYSHISEKNTGLLSIAA